MDSVRSLPDHALLDRLVRGRAWIPLLGVLLAGIVATQVEVLRMSASIGRSIASSTQLQIRNEQLRTTIASLADDQRIERLAASMGMVMPHPDMVGFLAALPTGALQHAARGIHPPDTTNFLYSAANYGSSATNGSLVTVAGLQAALTGSGVAAPLTTTGTNGVGAGSSTALTGNLNQTASPAQAGTTGTGTAGAPAGGGGGSTAGTQGGGAPGGTQGGGAPGGTQGGGAPGGTQGGGAPGGTQGGGTAGGGGGVVSGGQSSGGTSPAGAASTQPPGTQGNQAGG